MSIFDQRINFKPYEYPHLISFKDAIRHSYWIHSEFNLTSDIQHFKVDISEKEREAVKRAMLAISQIEVAVKTFWAKIHDRMPKPEIGMVGMTFAESEIRHADAYAFLLEQLGLNKEFETIYEIPAIIDRVNYLMRDLEGVKSADIKEYTLSILLFSVFIEHVSLFSQFLILMSFNKYKNLFKGISNIVEATSKEEEIHGRFGLEVVNIIRAEFPELFDEDMKDRINSACLTAYESELKILDWIFEKGELDFLSKNQITHFIRDRFNRSLESLQIKKMFDVDNQTLNTVKWFDEEILTTKDNDFFNKRGTAYSKKQQSFAVDNLF